MRILLAVSLILNLLLLGAYVATSGEGSGEERSIPELESAPGAERVSESKNEAAPVPAPSGEISATAVANLAGRLDDPEALSVAMRAAGYPESIIGIVVRYALSEEYDIPYTTAEQMMIIRGMTSLEEIEAYQERADWITEEVRRLVPEAWALQEDDDLIEELTGTDQATLRFGPLSKDEINDVMLIERFIREVSDAEYATLVREVLPPEHAEDYLTYNSGLARRLQLAIARTDIDEATYLNLYRQLREVAPDSVATLGPTWRWPEAAIDIFRENLGTEGFVRAAPGLSPVSAQINDGRFEILSMERKPVVALDMATAERLVTFMWLQDIRSTDRARELAREVMAKVEESLTTEEQRSRFSQSVLGRRLTAAVQ